MRITHRSSPAGRSCSGRLRVCGALLLALLAGVACGARAEAATDGAVTLYASSALESWARPQSWTPITVQLENAGGDLDDSIVVGVGRPPDTVRYLRPVRLATGARQRHILLVPPESYVHSGVAVRFGGLQETVALRELAGDDQLLLSVSDDQSGLSFLQGAPLPARRPRPRSQAVGPGGAMGPMGGGMSAPRTGTVRYAPQVRVAHSDAAGLFEATLAYDSVDAVALGSVSLRGLSVEQRRALREWVEAGGTLVVSGGSDTARLQDPLLHNFLPVEGLAPQVVPSLQGLNRRWGARLPIPEGSAVIAAGTARPGTTVLASQDGIPLVVAGPAGMGRVIFCAFDWDQAPVRGWSGQVPMWQHFLTLPHDPRLLRPETPPGLGMVGMMPVGAGFGLSSAVANVPAMDLPSAGLIGLFFLAYIICLVPVNYLVLSRFDRREYAWATSPVIVAVFLVIALMLGYGARGAAVLLCRLEVVECAPGSPVGAGEAYLGLFSPKRATYVLEAPGTVGIRERTQLGSYMGSSPQQTGGYTVVQEGNRTRIEDLAMNMWSMRVLMVPVRRELGGAVTAELSRGSGGQLQGRLVNGTRLSLEGGLLAHGTSVQTVGAIPAGGQVWVNAANPPQTMPPASMMYGPYGYGSIGTSAGRSARERIRAAALNALQGMLSTSGPLPDPVLIAWGETVGPTTVRLPGVRPKETRLGVFIFHLGPARQGTGALPSRGGYAAFRSRPGVTR